jgi:hypothetical protein
MFSSLMITTIAVPLSLGVLLGLFARIWPKRGPDLWLWAISLSAVYALLEGFPALPPIASKQKLSCFLLAAAVLAAIGPRLRLPAPVMIGAGLLAVAVWLGWPKIGQDGWSALAPVLAPIMGATVGSTALARAEGETFLWPLTLLIFATGGAVLSALGVFVGFAQVSGAFAAMIGGFLLSLYGATLLGRTATIRTDVITFLLLSCTGVVILIGLFAPHINVFALGLLSVTLLMPLIIPGFPKLPVALRPVAQGVLAAIPAAIALPLAYLQS